MSFRLTTAAVLAIYDVGCGASVGYLRDYSLIDGAVCAPFATFGGEELFPTIAQQAGKLLDAIQRAQAYTDGNKRLAWLSTVVFLGMNGQDLAPDIPAGDVDHFVRGLAWDPQGHATAAAWISDRLRGFV